MSTWISSRGVRQRPFLSTVCAVIALLRLVQLLDTSRTCTPTQCMRSCGDPCKYVQRKGLGAIRTNGTRVALTKSDIRQAWREKWHHNRILQLKEWKRCSFAMTGKRLRRCFRCYAAREHKRISVPTRT